MKMAFWKIITVTCAAALFVEAKSMKHQKRAIPSNICDPVHNNTNLIQCYCTTDHSNPQIVKNANCYLTVSTVTPEHTNWKAFRTLKNAHKITFTNTRGIPLTYVPTNSIIEANPVLKIEIKYGLIDTIEPFAFANISSVEEITMRDNKITSLSTHAFAHHKHLKVIGLDTNSITEINRNVFMDLPAIEKLFLTNNEISTIHDRAFIHLENLRELEIDRNKVFSLNFATFEGLKNLEKLDLSSNALEVIGDNTFAALENLKTLILDENKIQMLDDKAFTGLGRLISLSLARNKLTDIESDKVFIGLDSLLGLSLRANQIKELKPDAMAPILNHFYGSDSSFDVEDNKFPCSCKLDWFIALMNKTLNKHLKMALENFKCFPDAALRDAWTKTTETENTQQALEEEEPQVQDYEYYDETQLNGKLFYLDVRDLLNCDGNTTKNIKTMPETKEQTSSFSTTSSYKVANQDLLDLAELESTTAIVEIKADKNKRDKHEDVTTTRLATVSAKPVKSKIYDDMASDEPDKINAHKSTQEESKYSKASNADKGAGCATLLVFIISFRLYLEVN